MNDDLKALLENFRQGILSADQTIAGIRVALNQSIEGITIDTDRKRRTGAAEVIYGEHKSPEQIVLSVRRVSQNGDNVLATRVSPEAAVILCQELPNVTYYDNCGIATLVTKIPAATNSTVGVVTAGTSDIHIAEEATLTAEFYGSRVERIFDVGVAGIHRLLQRLEEIRKCRVVVVIAGMEGALPSVIAGLIDKPVIAVPTSVGYGAAFEGVTALCGMLTSCATGVSVVNIDNGFGAGYLANMINRL